MRKRFLLIIAIVVTLALCACGASSEVQQYARSCWRAVGSDDVSLDRVSVMRYTSRLHLNGEVLDSPMYEEIPDRGYAILFRAYGDPHAGMYACFLDERGKLIFSFNYEENYKLYEKYYSKFSIHNIEAGEKAVEYLGNCNYIHSMFNDAAGDTLSGAPEKNVWYVLPEEQVDRIEK